MVSKEKVLTLVFTALYTSLFFNWFIYLIQVNFEVIVDMADELLIKGFIIGFSGYFLCDRLKLPSFVPYGWAGIILGLNFTNYFMISFLSPYPSLLGLGLDQTLSMEFLFFKTMVVGTFLYVLVKGVIFVFFGREGSR